MGNTESTNNTVPTVVSGFMIGFAYVFHFILHLVYYLHLVAGDAISAPSHPSLAQEELQKDYHYQASSIKKSTPVWFWFTPEPIQCNDPVLNHFYDQKIASTFSCFVGLHYSLVLEQQDFFNSCSKCK